MSPVFRHGRLRLYLLKLLDESPRHGYEVIRLLQDRFMGVYAPSPGTIYPRLARLEEDGLVTHEEVDGKKVYSITDKGREEIRSRLGDLADLEDELTESLRDVAREISVDVRDTVRSIREELASAAREFRVQDGGKNEGARGGRSAGSRSAGSGAGGSGGGQAAAGKPGEASGKPGRDGESPSEEARRIREEARRSREQMRSDFRAQGRGRSDWAGWTAWSDWAGGRGDSDSDGTSASGEDGTSGAGDGPAGSGQRTRRGGSNPFSDLERMAMQFATELRNAAKQTGNLGERSLSDLRDILTDTLAKVRVEVFTDQPHDAPSGNDGPTGHDAPSGRDNPTGQDGTTRAES